MTVPTHALAVEKLVKEIPILTVNIRRYRMLRQQHAIICDKKSTKIFEWSNELNAVLFSRNKFQVPVRTDPFSGLSLMNAYDSFDTGNSLLLVRVLVYTVLYRYITYLGRNVDNTEEMLSLGCKGTFITTFNSLDLLD